MANIEKDVAIIGAGPVGLFAVFALGQLGLTSVVVDALHEVGGQCTALYPEKPIYDIPSRPIVTGGDLIEDLLQQAHPYDPVYVLGKKAEGLIEHDGHFEIGLSDGASVSAKTVMIAAGAGAFGPNRPPLADIDRHEGTSVFYSVRKPERFRDQNIVIAGGGDSAADWALVLSDIAKSVTIVHRRAQFRAAESTLGRLKALIGEKKITIAAPRSLAGLESENDKLSAVRVTDGEDKVEHLPADALLCFFGLAKDLSVIESWGIGAEKDHIPVEPSTMATIRLGVFAVGDIAQLPGKQKLILTGFAEAATAAHAIRTYLYPDQKFHVEYSTTKGRPGAALQPEAAS